MSNCFVEEEDEEGKEEEAVVGWAADENTGVVSPRSSGKREERD